MKYYYGIIVILVSSEQSMADIQNFSWGRSILLLVNDKPRTWLLLLSLTRGWKIDCYDVVEKFMKILKI